MNLDNKTLQKICEYWLSCIKNEDLLDQEISINVRTKAILYPFENDPLIFTKSEDLYEITDSKVKLFFNNESQGLDIYYGYPLLYFKEDEKHTVSPLFTCQITTVKKNNKVYLKVKDNLSTCGSEALTKLGLRIEEISKLNELIEADFEVENFDTGINKIIEYLKRETSVIINEKIDPTCLTNDSKIKKEMSAGLYNKSVLYYGETSNINNQLLNDLKELTSRGDLNKSALSFFLESNKTSEIEEFYPILPFQTNEYQLEALKSIFQERCSVVTGPPGTGKSQFISNLIINLYHKKKSVLFVSHTGEAVDIVTKKINEEFGNLIFRTGNKEIRQEMNTRLNELMRESSKRKTTVLPKIKLLWDNIIAIKANLKKRYEFEKHIEENFMHLTSLQTSIKYNQQGILHTISTYIQLIKYKLKLKMDFYKLNRIASKPELEKNIKFLENEYFTSCQDYTRRFFYNELNKNNRNIGKVNTFINSINNTRGEISDNTSFFNVLNALKIWSCTLKSLRTSFPLKEGLFDYVIFDEASQIDLPSAAPALFRAKNAIVVGDPMQLCHISGITNKVDETIAQKTKVIEYRNLYPSKIRYTNVSLYKAAENSLTRPPILLSNHYRSADNIANLCNKTFYGGKIKLSSSLNYDKFPKNLPIGVEWIDVKGETAKHSIRSKFNVAEINQVIETFDKIIQEIKKTDLTIGIVTPYSMQRQLIYDKLILKYGAELFEKHQIKILTAHKFQGSEKDIIIFSTVIADKGFGNSDDWFNFYPQILNVALSRAKYLLYIVGDLDFCKSRKGILGRISHNYLELKKENKITEASVNGKIDSPMERLFYEILLDLGLERRGYKIVPKLVVKRYTLDFALVGRIKINIEIDGYQHEDINGNPIIQDVQRDKFLKNEGWYVIRIPNSKLITEKKSAIDFLLKEINFAEITF